MTILRTIERKMFPELIVLHIRTHRHKHVDTLLFLTSLVVTVTRLRDNKISASVKSFNWSHS